MKDDSQNELLSAYLDGEATPEERAQVEQLLAASPAARHLLEELRALSSTLKSLPREKLGEDLSESVLKIAERRMLTEKMDTGSDKAPVSIFTKTILRRLKNPRILVWEAVIVAVVLLLLMFNPDQKLNQDAPPADRVERNIALAPKPEEKETFFEPPSIQAAPSTAYSDRDEAAALQKAPESKAVDKTDLAGRLGGVGGGAGGGVGGGLGDKEKIAQRESAAAAETPAGGGVDLARKRDLTSDDKVASEEMPQAALKSAAKPAEAPAEMQLAEQTKAKAAYSDELLVVQCEISPEAQNNHAFDKLLADNAIVWSEPPKENLTDDNAPKPEMIKSLLETNADQTAPRPEGADRSDSIRGKIEPLETGSLETGPLEIVYVEASPAQIEATINGLSAQSGTFKKVSVTQAKDGRQLQQLSASGNRRSEIPKAVLSTQIKAEQSDKMAEYKSRILPEGNSLGVANSIQGRAQRIPFSFGRGAQTPALQTLDLKQNAAGATRQFSPSARALNKPQAVESEQPPASMTASPAAPAPSQTVKEELPAQKARNSQEADSPYGGLSIRPSGPAASPGVQRVLFVLQVIGRKNFSENTQEPAAADAVPDKTAPADVSPANK